MAGEASAVVTGREVCGTCPRHGGDINPFCASLSPEAREVVCASAHEWTAAEGSWERRRSIGDSLVIMQEGMIITAVLNDVAKPVGIVILQPGSLMNIVGLCSVIEDDARLHWNDKHNAYLVKDSWGCKVSCSLLVEMTQSTNGVAASLLQQALRQYISAMSFASQVSTLGSEERVRWFLEHLRSMGADCSRITHNDIAKILSLNRVTVTRALTAVYPQME